jgi:hypothetical protein
VTDPREAGWYDDPGGDVGQLRWWDGSTWTGITRVRMPHEPAAMPPQAPAWSAADVLDADDRPVRSRWTWITVLSIVGVIAVLVLTGAFPGLDGSAVQSTAPDGRAGPPATEDPTLGLPFPSEPPIRPTPRPVSGSITDTAAGLAYDVLPGPWLAWDMFTFEGMLGSAGYYRVLQQDTPTGGEYWANVTSGLVTPGTASRADLAATARRLVDGLATSYYPKHTRRDLQQRSTTVDGRPGYLIRYLAVFDPTASKGYQAKSEQVTVLLVDTGRALPSALYVSLPDTVRASWPAVDALLASVHVLN